ncbi:MAG: flagellar hook-length control protein FliK [Rubrivivax sp.]|nr:flagellar hook-length control protein FliK [Rubrivivax sp.]
MLACPVSASAAPSPAAPPAGPGSPLPEDGSGEASFARALEQQSGRRAQAARPAASPRGPARTEGLKTAAAPESARPEVAPPLLPDGAAATGVASDEAAVPEKPAAAKDEAGTGDASGWSALLPPMTTRAAAPEPARAQPEATGAAVAHGRSRASALPAADEPAATSAPPESPAPAAVSGRSEPAAFTLPLAEPGKRAAGPETALPAPSLSAAAPAPALSAPTPPAEAAVAARPGSPEFASELGVRLATFVRDGVEQARLELHPVELGPVTVQIQLDGANASVHLAAEQAPTRQALEQALPTLAGTLREAGLTLAGGGVFEQPRQASREGGAGKPSPRGRDAGPEDTAGPLAGVAAPAALRRRGVVDLIA